MVRPTKVLFRENEILKSPILRACKSVKNQKTGFCQANHSIGNTKKLFETTAASSPREKRFRGYYLYAVDGMKGELPKTPELSEKYRISPQSEQQMKENLLAE